MNTQYASNIKVCLINKFVLICLAGAQVICHNLLAQHATFDNLLAYEIHNIKYVISHLMYQSLQTIGYSC